MNIGLTRTYQILYLFRNREGRIRSVCALLEAMMRDEVEVSDALWDAGVECASAIREALDHFDKKVVDITKT